MPNYGLHTHLTQSHSQYWDHSDSSGFFFQTAEWKKNPLPQPHPPWIVIWSSAVNKITFKIPTISMISMCFFVRIFNGSSDSCTHGASTYKAYTPPRFGASNSRITICYTLFQSDFFHCCSRSEAGQLGVFKLGIAIIKMALAWQ
jgi:hypothetical protein